MPKITLEKNDFLAKGGERTCFVNPLNKTQIIKIVHLKEKHNKQNELEYQYYNYLKRHRKDFSHIAKCQGWVDTNHGAGLVFDRVVGYNGKDSKHFRHYLKNRLLCEKTELWLMEDLRFYLEKNKILFIDASTVNLFCQETSPDKFKLIIFDGLGGRRLGLRFFLYLHSKALTKYKIKKQWYVFLRNCERDKA